MLAYKQAMRVLCRCNIDGGAEEDVVEAVVEGATVRSGCRTQLNSAWLS